jgi:hypothetical protein
LFKISKGEDMMVYMGNGQWKMEISGTTVVVSKEELQEAIKKIETIESPVQKDVLFSA